MTRFLTQRTQRAWLLGLVVLGVHATAAVARADITVCNHYTSTISYTETIPRSTCNTPWAQQGWWVISPGACVKVFVGNAGAQMPHFYYWAGATDGARWNGAAGVWYEPTSGHNDCYENFQLSCTNAGASCLSVNHSEMKLNPASYSLTITYSK